MVKKFIYKLVLFMIILIIMNLILNFLSKKYIYRNSVFYKVDEQFDDYNDTIKYLIIGDSHFQNGINPAIFKNSFNYSSPDECYIQTYYKLKNILEKGDKTLENVILIANPTTFCSLKIKRFKYDSYWVKNVDYFEVAKTLGRKDFLLKWLVGKYISYAGNGLEIIEYSLLHNVMKYSPEYHLGYRPRYIDLSKKTKEQISRNISRKFLYYEYAPGYFDKNLALYFERTLKLCIENNINILLMKVPVSSPYFERLNIELFSSDDVYDSLQIITDKYPGIVELDYLKLYFNNLEYFWSPDHMNDKGATAFSSMLNEKLN